MSLTHSNRDHSTIGASAAYRWINCPGSVKLLEDHPLPTSDAAALGTKAHELSELLLLDKDVEYGDYETEMLTVIREYTEWVFTVMNSIKHVHRTYPTLTVEKRFNLRSVSPNAFGTNDIVLSVDMGPLHVIDLKYGHRFVDVEDNVQLMYYALGAMEELKLDPTEVHLWIYGPNMGAENPAMHWECPMERLLEFHEELKVGAKRVETHPEEFNPGDNQCFYCNTAACPAIQKKMNAGFTDIEPVNNEVPFINRVSSMSNDELVERLKWKEIFDSAFKNIGAILKHRAVSGEEIPGHKLVKSEGNRVFKGDVTTPQIVKLGLPKTKLFEPAKRKSLAQIEKLLKEKYPSKKDADKPKREKAMKAFGKLWEKPDRGVKLVKDTNKGEPVKPQVEFEDIDDDSEDDDFGF